MKKLIASLITSLLLILIFAFSACSSDNSGTYYPDKNEMTNNMQTKGYKTYSSNWLEGNGTGIFFSAEKDDEYIKFYWLDNAADCEYYYNMLENSYTDCDVLVQIENDEKFGNIVYCGTSKAINDAGIKVVKVKV